MKNLAICEVTVSFYDKGDSIEAPEDAHQIWEKPVEDTTEENAAWRAEVDACAANNRADCHHIGKEPQWLFVEDNVGVDVAVVGDGHGPFESSGVAYELREMGECEVFEPELPDILEVARGIRQALLAKEAAMRDVDSSCLDLLGELDSPPEEYESKVIRFLGVWEHYVAGGTNYEGESDYWTQLNLTGVIDLNGSLAGVPEKFPVQRLVPLAPEAPKPRRRKK